MKVRHLSIKNFRGIKELSWHPGPGINCLIGPGDSGKSTILDAIDLLLTARRTATFSDVDFHDLIVAEPQLGKDVHDREGEAGDHVTAVEGVAGADGERIGVRPVDGNRLRDGIDDPDEADAVAEVELQLLGEAPDMLIG